MSRDGSTVYLISRPKPHNGCKLKSVGKAATLSTLASMSLSAFRMLLSYFTHLAEVQRNHAWLDWSGQDVIDLTA
jgi:hypothetical protein